MIMAIMMDEHKFFVHTSMVDVNDNIRPSAVLDMFQDAASAHAVILKVGYDDLLKLGLYWVILYEEFEILRDHVPFASEPFVRTWPRSRNRLEFEREYEMFDSEGILMAKGISSWCVIGCESRKLERNDRVVFEGEYYNHTNYPEKINRKLKSDLNDYDKTWDYTVLLTDLDHNKHMNNAKYMDIIYNMHASDKRIKKCRIAFVNEAHVGETLHVLYKHYDAYDVYTGIEKDKTCFIAEITTEE